MSRTKRTNNKASKRPVPVSAGNGHQPEPSKPSIDKLVKQMEANDKADWYRFYLGVGFSLLAAALGIGFTEPSFMSGYEKASLCVAIMLLGLFIIWGATMKYDPAKVDRRWAIISVLLLGSGVLVVLIVGDAFPAFKLNSHYATLVGLSVGFVLLVVGAYCAISRVLKKV